MQSQHEHVAGLMDQSHAATRRLAAYRVRTDGEALAAVLSELCTALFEHLRAEETHLLPIMARHITAEEWEEFTAQGMSSIPKRQLFLGFGMMLYEGDPEVIGIELAKLPAPLRRLLPPLGRRAFRRYARRIHGTPTPPRGIGTTAYVTPAANHVTDHRSSSHDPSDSTIDLTAARARNEDVWRRSSGLPVRRRRSTSSSATGARTPATRPPCRSPACPPSSPGMRRCTRRSAAWSPAARSIAVHDVRFHQTDDPDVAIIEERMVAELADGSRYENRFIIRATFRDGRIAEMLEYYGQFAHQDLLRRLGFGS